jgi:hypothetical protein
MVKEVDTKADEVLCVLKRSGECVVVERAGDWMKKMTVYVGDVAMVAGLMKRGVHVTRPVVTVYHNELMNKEELKIQFYYGYK